MEGTQLFHYPTRRHLQENCEKTPGLETTKWPRGTAPQGVYTNLAECVDYLHRDLGPKTMHVEFSGTVYMP